MATMAIATARPLLTSTTTATTTTATPIAPPLASFTAVN